METVELFFENFGGKEKPPLIVLHGFFASSRNWRLIAKQLANDFSVYALDLRNHGFSPHHALMDYPSMAADLLRFLQQHHLSNVSLLGHSMGGKVAMWFALNYPEYVDHLVLVDIAPVSYRHSFNDIIGALKALPWASIQNRKQAEQMLSDSIPELSFRQFLLQNLCLEDGCYRWRIDLDIFSRMADNIIAFPETGLLTPYQSKALFIAGEQSNYVRADDLVELFPHTRLEVIASAGHWLHVEQTEAFLALLYDYLPVSGIK